MVLSRTATPASDESQPSLWDGYPSPPYHGSRLDGDMEWLDKGCLGSGEI